ncbi:hypothetical protein SVXHr_1408 [Halorhabdus sp. SVX81]|nr:hypothetical protein SVXHr_1408 [Halorhabdus sp. SVX81]
MGFVVLLGYGIGDLGLGIQQHSPGWIAVWAAFGLYLGVIVLVVVYCRMR